MRGLMVLLGDPGPVSQACPSIPVPIQIDRAGFCRRHNGGSDLRTRGRGVFSGRFPVCGRAELLIWRADWIRLILRRRTSMLNLGWPFRRSRQSIALGA